MGPLFYDVSYDKEKLYDVKGKRDEGLAKDVRSSRDSDRLLIRKQEFQMSDEPVTNGTWIFYIFR